MGLVSDISHRILLHGTSRMWGESTAFLLAVSLTAGCGGRPAALPTDPVPPPHAEKTTVEAPLAGLLPGEVSSTSSADGHTHLQLIPLPELQEGDVIHLLADERVVATALITAVDATNATALVTGLTDRTRAVAVGDIAARLLPEDVAPASAAAPVLGAEATTVRVTVPPPVITETVAASSEHPPAVVEAVGVVAPQAMHSPDLSPDPKPELAPDVRARLTAERAYFDLATRVLRLPTAGPELIELQNRLRTELAELELLP